MSPRCLCLPVLVAVACCSPAAQAAPARPLQFEVTFDKVVSKEPFTGRVYVMLSRREVKDLFDPTGMLNPGKIVRPTKMDDRSLFRFKPGYKNVAYKPALDWSAWNVQNDPMTEALTAPGSGGDSTGGFAKAAEMCNNNGHCRKFDAGTMCPSFRVTRDEQHLTRGRANTLRLALSGQLEGALTSDTVAAAMDL